MTPFLFLPRLLRTLACLACASLLPAVGLAQPSGAEGDNFIYRVVGGDTLIGLSDRYTDKTDNWRALQTLNAVQEPTRLPIGMQLKIPFSMIPEVAGQANVVHVSGQAQVNQAPLSVGQQLVEGNAITTTANSFVTLTLADGSTLAIPAHSVLRLERLRVFKGTGLTDTIFTLEDGSLESEVAPQDTGVGRFEIRSPVSITGVRGTRLRVHANVQGAQSEVVQGTAVLSAGQAASAQLHPGQGAAVNASGKLLGVRPLLPAPDLNPPERQGGSWTSDFPPVAGAAAYLVRVAADPEGTQLFSSQRVDALPISFRAPGAGTYYVLVRAIDSHGLNGKDAVQPFLGLSVLQASDGTPILSGAGNPVVLTDY